MNSQKKTRPALQWALAALASSALLAACGGGGNGGSAAPSTGPAPAPAPTPIISGSNYESHAKAFGSVFLGSMAPIQAIGEFGISGPPQSRPSRAAALAPHISRLATEVAQRSLTVRPTIQGSFESSFACGLSGTVSFVFTDADNNSLLSLGDSVTITASNCKNETDGPTLNGSFGFKVSGLDFVVSAGGLEINNFDFALTLSQFGNQAGVSVTGSARFVAQGLSGANPTQRITYDKVTFSAPNVPNTVNNLDMVFRFGTNRNEFEVNGSYTRSDTFTLRQLSPYVAIGTDYPTQGQLRIQDANTAAVVLKARSDQMVDLEFYPAGSATATQVKTVTWDSLLGQ